MVQRTAVVVPGIMGSTLFETSATGERREIWSENFRRNYFSLLREPTMLRWVGQPAESGLLENIYLTEVPFTHHPLPLPKVRLWTKTLRFLASHGEFGREGQTIKYSYDWRRSLLETARELGDRLDQHARILENTGQTAEDVRFTFLTHSMGGLVVRIALSLGVLDPSSIDRIVHIGSPLRGAPGAFGSAYRTDRGTLPLLKGLTHFFHRRNGAVFFEHLLNAMQTFPSLYQLMPPADHDYLFYTWSHRSNPMRENLFPAETVELAREAHEQLARAEQIITDRQIRVFAVFGERHVKELTDLEYHVRQLGLPRPGYQVTYVQATPDGDGTVPKWSAEGGTCERLPLMNVKHMTMCNNDKVVGLLHSIL